MLSIEGAGERLMRELSDSVYQDSLLPVPTAEVEAPSLRELFEAISGAVDNAAYPLPDYPEQPDVILTNGATKIVWSKDGQSPKSLSYEDEVEFEGQVFNGITTLRFDQMGFEAESVVHETGKIIPMFFDEQDIEGLSGFISGSGQFEEVEQSSPADNIIFFPQAA